MSVERWLSPSEAAALLSTRAGRKLTSEDLKQMRRIGRIKNCRKVNDNLYLYDLDEIRVVAPPKQRKRKARG